MITAEQIAQSTGAQMYRVAGWLQPINDACAEFEIDTPKRQAMFLPQVGHESGGLVFVKELWGPTVSQSDYEGRADLGNNEPGDGFFYRGRGLIQITGRANYAAAAMALNIDCLMHPELLEVPENAARSAAWFWQSRHLNTVADVGDIIQCTKVINGGQNGIIDRQKLYKAALAAFGLV